MTSSPVPKLEEQPPTTYFTPPPPSPLTTTTTASSSSDVLATPTPLTTPLASPASAAFYQDEFRFQPAPSWHPTPSGPHECAHPVLPKQRRNRDDPGGDAARLAHVPTRFQGREVGPALLCLGENVRLTRAFYVQGQSGVGMPYYGAPPPGAAQDYTMAGMQQQPEPVVVPSQWKVGTVLDRLRFPQYGGDWDALMVALHGDGYQACMPRSTSPLSAEDMARESFSSCLFIFHLTTNVIPHRRARATEARLRPRPWPLSASGAANDPNDADNASDPSDDGRQ